ncbi:hypothetical protein [Synechococcus sp. PCC 7335]|uniref:hypothetical protein n=1 Tax=Synechococcus sp. (strain ATCC 29403 / PCC 7335) TaxID=91464 RepID=UPI000318B656|nr:hypothetical protein [Synechococcus sp. PCC 7335]
MSQLESPQQRSSSIKSSQARRQTYQLASLDDKRMDGTEHLDLLHLPLLIPKRSEPVASTGSILLDSLIEDYADESPVLQDLSLIEISTLDNSDPREQEPIESQEYREYLEQSYSRTASSQPKPPNEALDHKPPATSQNSHTSLHPSAEPDESHQPSAEQAAISIADDGPADRESAASVGLLNINDELLFGGAYSDHFSIDPYMPLGDDGRVYILTYLLQHLSAFTVSQLQYGFPYNADPTLINQPDSPRYLTVLEESYFDLDDLNSMDELDSFKISNAAEDSQLRPPNTKSEPEELSEQVRLLKEKIELLNQKLEQITIS